MPKFSTLSLHRLSGCHPDLQRVLKKAIQEVDFTILCGFRDEQEQMEAYNTGRSRLKWPYSKHNSLPSMAVDIAPWLPTVKIDWEDLPAFARLAGYIERVAYEEDVRLRWGGDWNMNFRTRDERLVDMPHFELVVT